MWARARIVLIRQRFSDVRLRTGGVARALLFSSRGPQRRGLDRRRWRRLPKGSGVFFL